MSILPSFISNDIVKKSKDEATIIEMPKEYGIDYATGQQTDCRAEIEEALTVNPWITGISDFSASIQTGKLRVKFTVLTKIGEVDINV